MASFNPHVGDSVNGGFTPLPNIKNDDFIDSIVQDVGPGVNGWSVYDDMRTSGSSYPILYRTWIGSGILNASETDRTNYGFNFVNGSPFVSGNLNYGFDWAYTIQQWPGLTPISVDGTSWYNAGWYSTAGAYRVARLEVNFSGTSGYRNAVYQRCTYYVVLQCSSSQKTFYVMIGQAKDRTGGPFIFTQCFETWNTGTHAGTNGGPFEWVKPVVEGGTLMSVRMQYISWFLPDVFALWTRGIYGSGTPTENFLYIGNIDTSTTWNPGTESDALVHITGDTTYSGYTLPGPKLAVYQANPGGSNGPFYTFSPIQCLRTAGGVIWKTPTAYNDANYLNSYQIFPQGRPFHLDVTQQMSDTQSRVNMIGLDLWHVGSPYSALVTEGKRGTLKYIKMPMGVPAGQNLVCTNVASDGYSYITLKTGPGWVPKMYTESRSPATINTTIFNQVNNQCTGWGWTSKSAYASSVAYNPVGECSTDRNTDSMILLYVMMPINA